MKSSQVYLIFYSKHEENIDVLITYGSNNYQYIQAKPTMWRSEFYFTLWDALPVVELYIVLVLK